MPEKELIRTESKNITLQIDANVGVRWLHASIQYSNLNYLHKNDEPE